MASSTKIKKQQLTPIAEDGDFAPGKLPSHQSKQMYKNIDFWIAFQAKDLRDASSKTEEDLAKANLKLVLANILNENADDDFSYQERSFSKF
jgi:hypothetical protein